MKIVWGLCGVYVGFMWGLCNVIYTWKVNSLKSPIFSKQLTVGF